MKKFIIIVLVVCGIGACSEKKKENRINLLSLPNVKMISCLTFVHPTKKQSVGDFQACRINNNKDDRNTSKCMADLGWERKVSKEGCLQSKNKVYYSSEVISACIEKATIDNKVDHVLINECLNEYVPSSSTQSIESIELEPDL